MPRLRFVSRLFLATSKAAIAFCALLYTLQGGAALATDTDAEAKVKLGYIFQLISYVEWPNGQSVDKEGNITICTYGKDAVVSALPLLSKSAPNIKVRNIMLPQPNEACNMLYIAKDAIEVLPNFAKQPILTLSSTPKFIDEGGMIGFRKREARLGTFEKVNIVFEVNQKAVHDSGMNINPDALQYADRVLR